MVVIVNLDWKVGWDSKRFEQLVHVEGLLNSLRDCVEFQFSCPECSSLLVLDEPCSGSAAQMCLNSGDGLVIIAAQGTVVGIAGELRDHGGWILVIEVVAVVAESKVDSTLEVTENVFDGLPVL